MIQRPQIFSLQNEVSDSIILKDKEAIHQESAPKEHPIKEAIMFRVIMCKEREVIV